jgi:hypothetical protein
LHSTYALNSWWPGRVEKVEGELLVLEARARLIAKMPGALSRRSAYSSTGLSSPQNAGRRQQNDLLYRHKRLVDRNRAINQPIFSSVPTLFSNTIVSHGRFQDL